jgi:hypothetical protein
MKEVLINSTSLEIRIATVEEGDLVEFMIERERRSSTSDMKRRVFYTPATSTHPWMRSHKWKAASTLTIRDRRGLRAGGETPSAARIEDRAEVWGGADAEILVAARKTAACQSKKCSTRDRRFSSR